MKTKAIFAFIVVVALVGVMSVNAGIAAADIPKFLTLHAAEQADFNQVGHICNENAAIYGGGEPGANCQQCAQKGYFGDTPYDKDHMYCTPQAKSVCTGYDVCFCSDDNPC